MMNLAEYRRTASRLADYLPWVTLIGEGVVLNKDGSFQRTAKFRGPDLDSAVAAELVAVAGRLNNAFRRLGSGWAIFVEAQRTEAATYPDSRFPDPASALVDAERKADFEEEGSHFVSGYFLTFLWLPPAEDAARSESWLYEGRETSGVNPWELVRGFTAGYVADPENSATLWAGGWLHTGDVACWDERGYLRITDRIKDVIKTGGEWVSSLEIEAHILAVASVQDVCVVAEADPKWGERPAAFIVTASPDAEAQIRAHLSSLVDDGQIPKYAVPTRIESVADIPRTSVGKPDKKALRARLNPAATPLTALAT